MSKKLGLAALVVASTLSISVQAACSDITYDQLQAAANNTKAADTTGGFKLNMWATFVDETGKVCAVVNTGAKGAASGNGQWLGSRVISAQKANTGNAFSLDGLAVSSGALFAAVQPGGSLYGLQESNPVNTDVAYAGKPAKYGTKKDPMVGKRIGGINVFGGGLPLYKNGVKIGGLGVSGDTSCTDHAFVWKMRTLLGVEPGASVLPVEKLNLTSTLDGLGDHPVCTSNGTDLTSNITDLSGFQAPL